MRSLAFVATLLLVAACGKNDQPPAASSGRPNALPETGPNAQPTAATPPVAALSPLDEANQLFGTLCATCHGPEGKGDGTGGATLEPKPRNYHDGAWQASVTDEQIATVIVKGGPGVGKSPKMPPNPQLEGKPQVVAELVKRIRSYAPAK